MRAKVAAKLTEEALAMQIETALLLIRESATKGKYNITITDSSYSNNANYSRSSTQARLSSLCYKRQ